MWKPLSYFRGNIKKYINKFYLEYSIRSNEASSTNENEKRDYFFNIGMKFIFEARGTGKYFLLKL